MARVERPVPTGRRRARPEQAGRPFWIGVVVVVALGEPVRSRVASALINGAASPPLLCCRDETCDKLSERASLESRLLITERGSAQSCRPFGCRSACATQTRAATVPRLGLTRIRSRDIIGDELETLFRVGARLKFELVACSLELGTRRQDETRGERVGRPSARSQRRRPLCWLM